MKKEKNSFEQVKKSKSKRKAMKTIVAVALVVAVVGGGVYFVSNRENSKAASVSNLTYQVNQVAKDEVSVTVSASGTMSPVTSRTYTAGYSGTVESITKQIGDTVEKGDVLYTVESDQLDAAIQEVQNKIDTLATKMATMDQTAFSKYIKSTVAGKVKLVKVEEGSIVEDVMEETGYLCVISTDGKMKVVIPVVDGMKLYDEVTVKNDDISMDGTISNISNGNATIIVDQNKYTVGTEVKVYSGDTLLGTSTLELNDYVKITANAGVVASVLKAENSSVSVNTNLFQLSEYPVSEQYRNATNEMEELQEQLAELTHARTVKAEYNGKITDLKVATGDSVTDQDTIMTVQGLDGYQLAVTVDELDIADMSLGLGCTITLDAVNGTYDGTVSYISNVGNTTGNVTNYDVYIKTDDIEGVLSGMSASATITTQSSGDTLVVPVNAVQTSKGESFLYVAPTGVSKGDELESSQVDISTIQKVTVETGMSDGSYIEVKGDSISEGMLVLVPVLTTTQDGSSSSQQNSGFGNKFDMNGQGMPGNMPSGSGSGMGGSRPDGASGNGASGNGSSGNSGGSIPSGNSSGGN